MPNQLNRPNQPLSYLLRLWPARENNVLVWRASLEDPHSGQRLGFATLSRLIAFLSDQTRNWEGENGDQARENESDAK